MNIKEDCSQGLKEDKDAKRIRIAKRVEATIQRRDPEVFQKGLEALNDFISLQNAYLILNRLSEQTPNHERQAEIALSYEIGTENRRQINGRYSSVFGELQVSFGELNSDVVGKPEDPIEYKQETMKESIIFLSDIRNRVISRRV